jgi:uncharacterized protein YndB with AHSA1/START domain
MTGTFQEIVAPERLVFTAYAEDHDGNALLESHTTVTFQEQGGRTKLTVQVRAVGLVDIGWQYLEGMDAGWTQSLERLGDLLAKA